MSSRFRSSTYLLTVLSLLFATAVIAGTPAPIRLTSDGNNMVFGGRPTGVTKTTVVDTQIIMGPWNSGAPYNGQFQTPNGGASWNGWTSFDYTAPVAVRWHADTYHAVNGTYSAWCGSYEYELCTGQRPDSDVGGYGNNWHEVLEWRGTVADPAQLCTINLTSSQVWDTEGGYDYVYISVVQGGSIIDLWEGDGIGQASLLNLQFTYLPGEYEGANNDEVVIQFRFLSDEGWSDEDCLWPTAGAIQLDDVQIALSNGTGYSHDFEDGTLGDFSPITQPAVGDFAKVWDRLYVKEGYDNGNISPMVAFIDDGLVVPGTGGTSCISYCYGPGGYVVNYTGGLTDPAKLLHNVIHSPVMPLPGSSYEGAKLAFDVWRDEQLGSASPNIFFVFSVRSTTSATAADIDSAPWKGTNLLFMGGPSWARVNWDVSEFMEPGAQWVQIEIGVWEFPITATSPPIEGKPAPYFDNVRLISFPHHGPAMSAQATQLPHDNFPESGTIDLVNLGNNSVRFDMGQPQSEAFNAATTPGDSAVISVTPIRQGATLVGLPRMYWRLQPNSLFDPYRSSGLPNAGSISGYQVTVSGVPTPNRYAFDLPDSGFLFPGDLLYYYFEATDVAGGVEQTITMPPDTTGFSDFSDPMAYLPVYKMHALPTIVEPIPASGVYSSPSILFWDDAGDSGNRDEWYTAFRNIGLQAGADYDVYHTNNPAAKMGQGLGGRATAAQMDRYETLIYTSGSLFSNLITASDEWDPEPIFDDVGVITDWLQLGDKNMILTGDALAGDLTVGQVSQNNFLRDWMGLDLVARNILPLIGQTTGAGVVTADSQPIFQSVSAWSTLAPPVTGTMFDSGHWSTTTRHFDAVTVRPGAQQLAQFLNPAGVPDLYSFSAATLNLRADFNAKIISFPYDFQTIYTQGSNNTGAPLAARTLALKDILSWLSVFLSFPSDVPSNDVFAARHYPNPFNPAVTIAYNLPRDGELNVKVFDVRGTLVRTLASGVQKAGPGKIVWNGRTERGEMAATGVYFYEARTLQDVIVGKMVLIK